MKIIVCGDRNWKNRARLEQMLDELLYNRDDSSIIDGSASGADTMATEWAEKRGVPFSEFPAQWEKYGKAAGPIRNQQMLTEGKPHGIIAFHDSISSSKGTKDMVARAKKAGLPVLLITNTDISWLTEKTFPSGMES